MFIPYEKIRNIIYKYYKSEKLKNFFYSKKVAQNLRFIKKNKSLDNFTYPECCYVEQVDEKLSSGIIKEYSRKLGNDLKHTVLDYFIKC